MSGSRAVKRGRRRRVVARRARMVEVRDHEEKKVARRLSRDSAVVVLDMLGGSVIFVMRVDGSKVAEERVVKGEVEAKNHSETRLGVRVW